MRDFATDMHASGYPTLEMIGPMVAILHDVLSEREVQRVEFTVQHDDELSPAEWIARIVKHVGRAVTFDHLAFRRAMVVVGAIALAAIEWHDRRYRS